MIARLVVLCLAPVALAQPATAQPPEADAREEAARDFFARGSEAYDAGEFAVAMRYFREAYELSGRPELLFNMGAAADRLRHDEEALDYYRQFLAAMPESPHRSNVRARIEAIEAARAGPTVEQPVENGSAESDEGTVFERWWFWALIGAAVAAGVVLTVFFVMSDGGQTINAPDGNVMALRFP